MNPDHDNAPLKICFLSYRSKPHCGGQGVYLANLCKAVKKLGHEVEVVSGPPYPPPLNGIKVNRLPSLDLYNPDNLFRMPTLKELSNPVNLIEWMGVSSMGFPEPFTFGIRAYRYLKNRLKKFDIIHDNQSLSYGIGAVGRLKPTVATIHHPIMKDMEIELKSTSSRLGQLKIRRWYSFIGMQKKVARRLSQIITVSDCAAKDIVKEFRLPQSKIAVVPNGIDTDIFHPVPEIDREQNRIITTCSADTPLKGLEYLLKATATLLTKRNIKLIVVGTPKKNGQVEKLIGSLGIGKSITFTGPIDDARYVREYAQASIAVVPSVYEGFGLPAGEAMACGIPVISTTGGALSEVVGNAGVLVPPRNHSALAEAVMELLDNPDRAAKLGDAGLQRIEKRFTWKAAALKTVAIYRKTIDDFRRLQQT